MASGNVEQQTPSYWIQSLELHPANFDLNSDRCCVTKYELVFHFSHYVTSAGKMCTYVRRVGADFVTSQL